MTDGMKDAIKRFRASSEALGYPLDHVNDEELLAGIQRLSDTVNRAGYSMALTAAGYKNIGKGWTELLRAADKT
jgi:hypothetical protein